MLTRTLTASPTRERVRQVAGERERRALPVRAAQMEVGGECGEQRDAPRRRRSTRP